MLKLRARKREEAAAAATGITGEQGADKASRAPEDVKVIDGASTSVLPVTHRPNSSKPRRPSAILAKADDNHWNGSDGAASSQLVSSTVPNADELDEQNEAEPQSTTQYNVVDFVGHSRRSVISGYPGFMRHMASNLEVHSSFPFVSAIEDLGSSNRLSAVSIYAFGATITGIMNQDMIMIHRGTQAYRQVLRAMRALLVDSNRYKLAPLLPVIFNVLLGSVEASNLVPKSGSATTDENSCPLSHSTHRQSRSNGSPWSTSTSCQLS